MCFFINFHWVLLVDLHQSLKCISEQSRTNPFQIWILLTNDAIRVRSRWSKWALQNRTDWLFGYKPVFTGHCLAVQRTILNWRTLEAGVNDDKYIAPARFAWQRKYFCKFFVLGKLNYGSLCFLFWEWSGGKWPKPGHCEIILKSDTLQFYCNIPV